MKAKKARKIVTNINALLEIAWWTKEDEGTSGRGVREELFALMGNEITDDEIDGFVVHYARKMHGLGPDVRLPPDPEEDDDIRRTTRAMVDDMKADAAWTAAQGAKAR